jgi:acetyltransferase-like isoleucine patch superfamily enzyme
MIIEYLKELIRPAKLLAIIRHFRQTTVHKDKDLKLGLYTNLHNVRFGNKVYIGQNCSLSNCVIDSHSYCNNNTNISNAKIGKYSSIGSNVQIGVGAHPTNLVTTHPAFYSNNKTFETYADKMYYNEFEHIEIGNDVWIGSNSTIMNNVKIGNGAIIAYGAVVTKDVLPYSIVGGIPAKHIKFRFDQNVIMELIRINWWNWDENFLKENFTLFQNPETLINYYKNHVEIFKSVE